MESVMTESEAITMASMFEKKPLKAGYVTIEESRRSCLEMVQQVRELLKRNAHISQ